MYVYKYVQSFFSGHHHQLVLGVSIFGNIYSESSVISSEFWGTAEHVLEKSSHLIGFRPKVLRLGFVWK